jgi:D-sedoheptulose 7-phosphate isomerase
MFFKIHSEKFRKIISGLDFKKIQVFNKIIKSKKKKNKIHIFGNGAGASIASHFANDLTNNSNYRVYSYDSSAQITCLSNDYKYSNWVKKIIDHYVDKKDLVILISASGEPRNMIEAARFCKKKKFDFVSLTGFNKKNSLNNLTKNFCWINSNSCNYVELAQPYVLLSIVDNLSIKKN